MDDKTKSPSVTFTPEKFLVGLLGSPLVRTGDPALFIRQVLIEMSAFGVPPAAIAAIDDIASMFGFYAPLPENQSNWLRAPIVRWRTHHDQPIMIDVKDVLRLVHQQRAEIVFGAGVPGHMVGTAEIVGAMGNTHPAMQEPEYMELFQWAATDVLSILLNKPREDVIKSRKGNKEIHRDWKLISDDEVVKPGGRLHDAYMRVVTSLRRGALARLDLPEKPRDWLKPTAAVLIESHVKWLEDAKKDMAKAEADNDDERATDALDRIEMFEKIIARLERAFPADAERAEVRAAAEARLFGAEPPMTSDEKKVVDWLSTLYDDQLPNAAE